LTRFQARGYWLGRCSIPVSTPKNLETFKEFAVFPPPPEFFWAEKPVMLSVSLTLPSRPGWSLKRSTAAAVDRSATGLAPPSDLPAPEGPEMITSLPVAAVMGWGLELRIADLNETGEI
jgi:hypothetical protein